MNRPRGLKYKKHKDNPTSFKKGLIPWNKGKKGILIPWNKGLSKETDTRVSDYAKKIKDAGIHPPRSRSAETFCKIAASKKGDKNPAKRPEVREKIKISMMNMYKMHPEILANRKSSGINQHSEGFTSIERLIAKELESRNIVYIHNARVGRYFPDFIIFDRVIIECDGAYWHKDAKKEKARDSFLHSRDYLIYHFSENRIRTDASECVDVVLATFEEAMSGMKYFTKHKGAAGFVCETLPWIN